MYREMRRKDRKASMEEAMELLKNSEYGILATLGQDNMPYAVPLSYAYIEHSIYIHCATEGHKLDNIKANPKVSFCVVGDTELFPGDFSTNYESVVVFGIASIVEDKEEKIKGLKVLIDKYSPDFQKEGQEYINRAFAATCVIKIDIEHLSGKKRAERP